MTWSHARSRMRRSAMSRRRPRRAPIARRRQSQCSTCSWSSAAHIASLLPSAGSPSCADGVSRDRSRRLRPRRYRAFHVARGFLSVRLAPAFAVMAPPELALVRRARRRGARVLAPVRPSSLHSSCWLKMRAVRRADGGVQRSCASTRRRGDTTPREVPDALAWTPRPSWPTVP